LTNPVFPTLTKTQDSKFYGIELEDTGLKTPMDGGYVVSRARHTRRPRRTFRTGFTDLTPDDATLLENFYDLVRGSSVVFDWTDPITTSVWQVRFIDKLSFQYTGVGISKRWDVQFSLEQA
jgi:hypothetical protein